MDAIHQKDLDAASFPCLAQPEDLARISLFSKQLKAVRNDPECRINMDRLLKTACNSHESVAESLAKM